MTERTCSISQIKDELRRLRDEIKKIDPLFTVNISTQPKVAVRFSAPSFYEEGDNFKILQFSENLVKAFQIIESFEFNNYIVDINKSED